MKDTIMDRRFFVAAILALSLVSGVALAGLPPRSSFTPLGAEETRELDGLVGRPVRIRDVAASSYDATSVVSVPISEKPAYVVWLLRKKQGDLYSVYFLLTAPVHPEAVGPENPTRVLSYLKSKVSRTGHPPVLTRTNCWAGLTDAQKANLPQQLPENAQWVPLSTIFGSVIFNRKSETLQLSKPVAVFCVGDEVSPEVTNP